MNKQQHNCIRNRVQVRFCSERETDIEREREGEKERENNECVGNEVLKEICVYVVLADVCCQGSHTPS